MSHNNPYVLSVRTTSSATCHRPGAVREPGRNQQGAPSESDAARNGCLICHSTSCQLVTHRLLTLDILRRLSKSSKESDQTRKTRLRNENVVSLAFSNCPRPTPIVTTQSPGTPVDSLDPFTPFPLKGVKRETVRLFHEFFDSQGRSLLEFERELSFDSSHLPALFTNSIQSPALAMSLVSMAATFHAVQGPNLTVPDHDLLAIYTRAFAELRKQIHTQGPGNVSEDTIMAAINMCMCSGIGIGDPAAALLHWQGILALLEMPHAGIHSGFILTFANVMEHWLVLTTDYVPRARSWPSIVPHEKPPPAKYGASFGRFVESSIIWDHSSMPMVLDLCLTACRATEVLEAHATRHVFNRNTRPSTYYNYLRDTCLSQSIIVHRKSHHSDTLAECLSLSANLYYVMALRRTPWKAPLRLLCSELRRAITNSRPTEDEGYDDEADDSPEEERALRRSIYNWMLIICTCAANLAHDRPTIEWAKHELEKVRLAYCENNDTNWKGTLVRDLGQFIWSDMFLAGHLQTICNGWMERRDSLGTSDTK